MALKTEAQREKMDQVLGHEPMYVGSAHKNQEVGDKLMSIMETMQRHIDDIGPHQ